MQNNTIVYNTAYVVKYINILGNNKNKIHQGKERNQNRERYSGVSSIFLMFYFFERKKGAMSHC